MEEIPRKFRNIAMCRLNLKDDNRPYLFVRISDDKARGLLDSGAMSSIMNRMLYDRLFKSGLKLYPCDIYMTTADGASHKALGYMKVPYLVRGVKRMIKTLVVEQSEAELILGMDFWNAFRIKPCFTSNTFGISVASGESTLTYDPNEHNASERIDFEADITPPKCINVEQEHDLTNEERDRLNRVIETFPFCSKEGELNKTQLRVAQIDTGDAKPVRCKLRIEPPHKQKLIIEEIERLERRGIIRKVESSEWLQPLMAVPKPNGKWRICLDARWLNAVTKKNCYPQQNANRILSLIGKAKYITTIDMTDAYFQVPLHADSQEKTAFAVPTKGTYVYNRMPMGLTNSGAVLCSLIDSLFGAEFEPHVFPYLDDIVIVSETFDDHLDYLSKVAQKLRYANLTISTEKSKFGYKRLRYLGHIIDEEGIAMDKSRVEAVENFPIPTCRKDIQRLMGMAGWYRRFIDHFADITAPISELLKKTEKFVWTDERQRALNQLIVALTTAPVLATPDYSLPFEIQADASKRACGAVLIQRQNGVERVIAYMSQKFTATQQKYGVTELECLAVILSIEKFRPYVEGSHFRVITDHHSLLWLKNLRDPNGRLARWALRLQAYDYTLVHRKGKHHIVPDTLSRNIATISTADMDSTTDKWYRQLKEQALENPQNHDNLKVENGLLYIQPNMNEACENPTCTWRLCIPKEKRMSILKDYHDGDSSCHFGRFKTTMKIRSLYFWPKMNQTIARYVQNCAICKQTKAHNQITTPPAGKFIEAKSPWRHVATDICGPFPRSRNGHQFVIVAIDLFSKFVIIKPLRSATAKTVTDFVKNDVVLKYACPKILVNDNGPQYRSEMYKSFADSRGIEIWYTANYFAQANPTECVNKTIGNALRAFLINDVDHRNWDEKIPEIANAINCAVHTTTGETPFEINFGQKMPQHADEYKNVIEANNIPSRTATEFGKLRDKVQQRINEAREKYTNRYNLRTREIKYNIGDIVFRENTILSDASKHLSKKLSKKSVRSEIVEKTGTNTYKLKDLATGKINEYHAQKFHK